MARIVMNVCVVFIFFSEFTYDGVINILFMYSNMILNQTLYKLKV